MTSRENRESASRIPRRRSENHLLTIYEGKSKRAAALRRDFLRPALRPFPRSLVHREITLSRDRFLERKARRDTRVITRASIGNRVFSTDTLLLEGRESCVNLLSRLLAKGILRKNSDKRSVLSLLQKIDIFTKRLFVRQIVFRKIIK